MPSCRTDGEEMTPTRPDSEATDLGPQDLETSVNASRKGDTDILPRSRDALLVPLRLSRYRTLTLRPSCRAPPGSSRSGSWVQRLPPAGGAATGGAGVCGGAHR